jgi:acyl carrier protein
MDIAATVRAFIIKNFYVADPNALDDRTSLLDRGIIDSTGVLEVIAFLEKEMGIEVKDAEMIPDNLDSIEKIAAFVARKRG